jgi:tripartite-type tricarboxylate transporter receptor subunit TctC
VTPEFDNNDVGGIREATTLLRRSSPPWRANASARRAPKSVRVIIPFPPGGTLDALGRALAQKLSDQMGQQFVVETKPGGNGIIGADAVAKAPADGYTLLFNASTFVTAPMTMKQVPYGVVQDFTPVALVAKAPLSVAIAKDLPVTDIKSLIAYAKSKNGNATFAVGSIGSAGHLATELLKRAGGIEYTSSVQGHRACFQDLLGGRSTGSSTHPRIARVSQGGAAPGRGSHLRNAHAQPARRPDRRRDDPRLRVLQLVRALGPGEAARRHPGPPEYRGEQGARH